MLKYHWSDFETLAGFVLVIHMYYVFLNETFKPRKIVGIVINSSSWKGSNYIEHCNEISILHMI